MATTDFLYPFNLSGRTIIVTGASSGIGSETSRLLAQLGAKIVLVGRDISRLETQRSSLKGEGHIVEKIDLTENPDSLPDWMKKLGELVGPINGIAHCAGAQLTLPLMASKSQDFEKLYLLNVVAGAMLIKGLRQRSVVGATPSAVLISSVRGLTGEAAVSAYSATKGAVISLVRSLAVELAPQGIRVNCVAPGFVQTEMTKDVGHILTTDQLLRLKAQHPLGIGTPQDVANAVAFLLSDAARWITGSTLVVDGGFTAQ